MPLGLHGRAAELTALTRIVERLGRGRGAVCIVTGTSGSGKTRLLAEAAACARRSGLPVAESSADELDAAAPLTTLLSALRSGPRPVLDEAMVDRLLRPGVQPLWILEQLRRALEVRSRTQPLLVLLDDVQHADPLSLLAIRTLVPALARQPVTWILARHPAPTTPALDRLSTTLQQHGATVVSLPPLRQDALEAIARDVLSAEPDDAVRAQLDRSGGVPAVAIALVDHLRQCREGSLDADAPDALGLRLRRQLRPLSAPARQVVEVAAVHPFGVTVEEVAATLQWPVTRVLPHVRDAIRAGILDDTAATLTFPVDPVRQAVTVSMTPAARQALEQEVARVRGQSRLRRRAGVNGHGAEGRNGHEVPYLNGSPHDGVLVDGLPAEVAGWQRLTRAESRVAMLVAQGLSNRGVAEQLFCSQHTVDSHLKHVFAKLGIHSRVQLARTVLARGA